MTRSGAIAILVVAMGLTVPAAAQDLTIALSTEDVQITSNFSGGELTVFGVVETDDPPPARGYDVVVALRGPAQNVAVRRKDRVLGIWLNLASETVLAAPSYYAMHASAPLASIAKTNILDKYVLGLANIGFVYRGKIVVNDQSADEFRQAFLRLKIEDGLFSEATDVSFIGESVFRTTFELPANVPVGKYVATVHVFDDGELLAWDRSTMRVTRSSGERLLFDFSRNQSAIYGLIAVFLALFVGWLGGVIFRRD